MSVYCYYCGCKELNWIDEETCICQCCGATLTDDEIY